MANVISNGAPSLLAGQSQPQPAGTAASNTPQPVELTSPRSRAFQLVRRIGRCAALVLAFYGAACLIGLSPVNTNFTNAPGGTEVFVYTDHLQSKIVVPVRSQSSDWEVYFPKEEFPGLDPEQKFIAFSWEDREFAANTPTWQDANCLTAARAALLPTRSALRVEFCERPQQQSGFRRMMLDGRQYAVLSQQILGTLDRGRNSRPQPIPTAATGPPGGLYEAHGLFYFLSTGNNWTGACLKRAGVQTGMWTPFSVGVAQVAQ